MGTNDSLPAFFCTRCSLCKESYCYASSTAAALDKRYSLTLNDEEQVWFRRSDDKLQEIIHSISAR